MFNGTFTPSSSSVFPAAKQFSTASVASSPMMVNSANDSLIGGGVPGDDRCVSGTVAAGAAGKGQFQLSPSSMSPTTGELPFEVFRN